MDKKEVKIVFSSEAKEVYEYLNREAPTSKNEMTLFNAIQQKIKFIRENPQYGNPISKKLIPREYKEKYGNINLFGLSFLTFGECFIH